MTDVQMREGLVTGQLVTVDAARLNQLINAVADWKQRAKAAEKALAELATTSSALVCALDTCHVCAGEVCLDTTEPTHCEDCSADCECHEGDECVPLYVLVDKVSAAIRAARGKKQ